MFLLFNKYNTHLKAKSESEFKFEIENLRELGFLGQFYKRVSNDRI